MSLEDGIVDEQILQEIEQLVANATGGASAKWVHPKAKPGQVELANGPGLTFLESMWSVRASAIADVELVVALRNNALRLVATLRELRELREEARVYAGSAGSRLRAAIDKSDRGGRP